MPSNNNKINQEELKKILKKYISGNLKESIEKAFKKSGKKTVTQEEIDEVLSKLSKSTTITEKLINEAVNDVSDQGALADLKFLIARNIRALGKKIGPQDVTAIIKKGKLDPKNASLQQIKDAVKKYYSTGKNLEDLTPTELRNIIKDELSKNGSAVDARDIKLVLDAFLKTADPEKEVDPKMVTDLVAKLMARKKKIANVNPSKEKVNDDQPTNKSKIEEGGWVPPKNPKNLTFFEDVRTKMRRYGLKALTKTARNWLLDTINKTKRSPSRTRLLKEGESVAEALVGKMFMYFYDAKTKEELPYWDKFPLIFVIDLLPDGWLGLNLHYLDINLRLKLFDKLLAYSSDKSLDKIKKLQLSYALIKGFSKIPEARPCIKRYLSNYVKSELMPVEPINWEIAVFLPVEQFQKSTNQKVWNASRSSIGKKAKKANSTVVSKARAPHSPVTKHSPKAGRGNKD